MAYKNSGIKLRLKELTMWLVPVINRAPKNDSSVQHLCMLAVDNLVCCEASYYVAYRQADARNCLRALDAMEIHLLKVRFSVSMMYGFSSQEGSARVISESQHAAYDKTMKLLEHQIDNFRSRKLKELNDHI